jgi:hypothetical protein
MLDVMARVARREGKRSVLFCRENRGILGSAAAKRISAESSPLESAGRTAAAGAQLLAREPDLDSAE